MDRNERTRIRYATDPEFRKRRLATDRRSHAAHRDEINERRRRRWATDPEYRSKLLARGAKADLKRRLLRHGLSLEEYEALLRTQNGACAICKKKPARWLCIDHCHSTGVVRGLLCVKCNTGLGLYNEDPSFMHSAIAYLEAIRPPRQASEAPKIFLRADK